MYKTNMVLLSHCHVPYGSAEEDFEEAYERRVRPFMTALYRYPSIPAAVHYSGVFLEWLNSRHSEFIALIAELVNRKQVEILGGGYYEPAFTLIPQADRIAQVELQTTLIRRLFGKRPRGCLLPFFLWDPSLVGVFNTCGMDYLFLGAEQFRVAGMTGEGVESPVLTEDQGRLVTVLPVSDRQEIDTLIDDPPLALRSLAKGSVRMPEHTICLFPESSMPCSDTASQREKHLDLLFQAFPAEADRFVLTLPGKLVKSRGDPRSDRPKVFFPNSASRDFMFQALDASRREAWDELRHRDRKNVLQKLSCLPGGAFPRQFLMRYEESSNMYAKMNCVHLLVNQLRGDKYRKKSAREELLKSQGLDAFVHMESGGIHVNRLRKAVYRAQIQAEKITRQKGAFTPCVMVQDFRLTGHSDYLFLGNELNVFIKTKGGSVFELDQISKAWNYLDTMARRADGTLSQDTIHDEFSRSAFLDFLLPPDASFRDARHGAFLLSRQCGRELYEEIEVDRSKQVLVLRLSPAVQGAYAGVEIIKRFALAKNALTVSYCLHNLGKEAERFNFAPRIDLSLADEDRAALTALHPDGSERPAAVSGEIHGASACRLTDAANDLALEIAADRPLSWWLYPVFSKVKLRSSTVDQYQSTCISPVLPVVLAPGESWSTAFTLSIAKM